MHHRIRGERRQILPLTAWESFYVIVGSSAAALTGLQFVVIALIAESRRQASGAEIAAFGSPTVVHFCAALFVSASMSAPWPSEWGTGLTVAACGIAGVMYASIVARRTRRQTGYKPELEDNLWHIAFPFVAYAALVSSGITLSRYTVFSLFTMAAATLLLVYIGIHNAWDTVIFITVTNTQSGRKQEKR
jgi:hypothetical protein